MANDILANCLRELRAKHGWTQETLANKVDVTRQTIIALEKGQYNPSLILALKLAHTFQVPLEAVFWLDDASEK